MEREGGKEVIFQTDFWDNFKQTNRMAACSPEITHSSNGLTLSKRRLYQIYTQLSRNLFPFFIFIIKVMPDIKYHCQADQNDKNDKGGGESDICGRLCSGGKQVVASFPKAPAQVLPKHKSHRFWGEPSEDNRGIPRLGPTCCALTNQK